MLCGMNCSVSDLNFAKEKVFKDLKDNINRSLSALFRDIRKSNATLGLGDWPIMSMIVQGVTKFRNLNRGEIKYMGEWIPVESIEMDFLIVVDPKLKKASAVALGKIRKT